MPTIQKSELRKIRSAFYLCRFPSLDSVGIKRRKLLREDDEFRENFIEHNRRIAKTKLYSPETYEFIIKNAAKHMHTPEALEKKKKTLKKNRIIGKRGKASTYDPKVYNRPNDYAGVITMSEFNSL